MADFFWFSDEQWARIEPLLPTDTRGMARVDDRRVLSGIIHALKNGGRWADCHFRSRRRPLSPIGCSRRASPDSPWNTGTLCE